MDFLTVRQKASLPHGQARNQSDRLTAQRNHVTVAYFMMHESSQPFTFPPAAVAALEQGNTIEAIKIVRLDRNLGLKESKDLVDAYLKSRPDLQRQLEAAQAEARQGFVRWLVIFLALAAMTAYFLTQGK